ncbi:MAG TPA: MarR family transcriptional regulator [Gaiellaceae bacterium]
MSRENRIYTGIDLLRQNQVLTQMLDEKASEYLGINTTDGHAIDVIDRAGRITAGDLARELRLSTGAVTAIVDRLEKAGYARRVPDPDDRRRVLVEVTPKLSRAAAEIYGAPDEAIANAAEFTDEELGVWLRFEEQSRQWLENRLEHVEQLIERKRTRRMRGHGRA